MYRDCSCSADFLCLNVSRAPLPDPISRKSVNSVYRSSYAQCGLFCGADTSAWQEINNNSPDYAERLRECSYSTSLSSFGVNHSRLRTQRCRPPKATGGSSRRIQKDGTETGIAAQSGALLAVCRVVFHVLTYHHR